jgi:hypothetical protein
MTDREVFINLIDDNPMIEYIPTSWCEQLADHLITHGAVIQKWIPISELPKEKRKNYLCYHKYEPESPDVICENFYYGSGRWMSESDKVTHWMPLMKRPKEDR